MNTKISKIEAICLIIVLTFNNLFFGLPKSIIQLTGSSSTLNIIYITLISLIIFYFINKLFNNFKNSDITDISEFLGGKILKCTIGILFIIFFIFTSGMFLRAICEVLSILYFPHIPINIILLIFLFVGTIANVFCSNSILKINVIISTIIFLTIILTSFALSSEFVFQRLFPILGYGFKKTFIYGITNIFSFNGLLYIYFIMPILKQKEDFKLIGYFYIIISSIFLIISITSFLISFSFIGFSNETIPMLFLIRSVDFGDFFQRPESIFVLFWIIYFMAYLSINLFLSLITFKKMTNIKNIINLSPLISSFIYITAMIPTDIISIRFLEDTIYKYYLIVLFIIAFIILILANIKYHKLKLINKKEA